MGDKMSLFWLKFRHVLQASGEAVVTVCHEVRGEVPPVTGRLMKEKETCEDCQFSDNSDCNEGTRPDDAYGAKKIPGDKPGSVGDKPLSSNVEVEIPGDRQVRIKTCCLLL